MIYGVAILAGCFLLGKVLGEILGQTLAIDANLGGVGFSMVLFILVTQWMQKKGAFTIPMERGIIFWSNMYIPVIVAMSAIQNVKGALSGGALAVFAGILPTALCLMLIPRLSRIRKKPVSEREALDKPKENGS